ncbi:hypothetical protein DFH94DRAFT_698702 [Russula ochroleuca]|uniref:Uncharacterized protein n=1 Tax=Russula ochroleuca TaxID=152965 RepID=A0A9P5JVL7_9AGAM|nr:hypothetical protein DFH94DRAFT_698702 [Russula ochroleuca]
MEDAGDVDINPFEPTEEVDSSDSSDEDAEANYTSIKALGDTDCKVCYFFNLKYRPKTERTADVRTVFTADSNHLNLDTGKPEKGHLCMLCKKAGIAARHTFFTGGVSTLCTHISHYKDHFKVYKEQCEMLGIPVYQHATLKSQQNTGLMCQGTLDSIITNQPHSLPFTQAGLLDYIIELVVSVDNVFQLVDRHPFRQLLMYIHPSLEDKDIPHRTKL